MPVKHKKASTFVRTGFDPYFEPLRKNFQIQFDKAVADIRIADQRITDELEPEAQVIEDTQIELDANISLTEQAITATADAIEPVLNNHISAINPHKVKLSQLITVKSVDPVTTQGSNGDIWLAYLQPSFVWSVSTWTACSVSCGGGVQTRTVQCLRNDGVVVQDETCIELISPKPVDQQVCNTQACIYLRTVTNSDCGFTCANQPMCTYRTYNVDNTNGQYNYIDSFALPNNGLDYYWRFPFSVHDVAIWVKLAITSSIRGMTDIPMLCADYAPKTWNPPRITSFSAYYCELSFPNEQTKGSIWIMARIPASYVGPDGLVNAYIYTGDRKNYSGNTVYVHNDPYTGTNDRCSRVCLG